MKAIVFLLLATVACFGERVRLENWSDAGVSLVGSDGSGPYLVPSGGSGRFNVTTGLCSLSVTGLAVCAFDVKAETQVILEIHGTNGAYAGSVYDEGPSNTAAVLKGLYFFGGFFLTGLMIRLVANIVRPSSGEV